MNMEPFSIVDSNDEHLRTVFGKYNLHISGGYHRAVHIFVEVFGGWFILQKKAAETENGGKWSSSVSGHVRCDESYEEAAIRELDEEIGLKVKKDDLQKVMKIPPSDKNTNEFVTLFTYLMDPDQEDLKLDANEVDEVIIGKLADIIGDVEKHKNEYSPAFVDLFNKFLALERGIELSLNETANKALKNDVNGVN